jgi:hypothetical protein
MGGSYDVRHIYDRYLDYRIREAWKADQAGGVLEAPRQRRGEEAT